MRSLGLGVSFAVLIFGAGVLLSCGGGSSSQRQLTSISLVPASADAKDYPNGEVQFLATGTYSAPPSPVVPIGAQWGACAAPSSATTSVTVSSSGQAQCAAGASGTFTVWASDPATLPAGAYTCPIQDACGGGCNIEGKAQLTCP
jgi:hypothetical protein